MKKGKRICDTLKAVRQLIAKENGIIYKPRECNFTGDCSGTCPACEAEMKYLEQQLIQRKKSGLPLKLTGIAITLCASQPVFAQYHDSTIHKKDTLQQTYPLKTTDLSQDCTDIIKIKGIITYQDNNTPLAGTLITLLNPDTTKTNLTALTNINGEYSIIVPRNSVLEISYIGCDKQVLTAKELKTNSNITLNDSQTLLGEIKVIKKTTAPTH